MRFAGDALTGGYVDSAGDGGASIHKALAKKSPNYGALGTTSMAEQAKERMTAISSEGQITGAGLQSMGKLTEASNMATAGIAAAESEASATRQNGMMSMIGSIGGGAMGAMKPKFEYGQTRLGAGGGVVDGYGTLGPNYGIKQ